MEQIKSANDFGRFLHKIGMLFQFLVKVARITIFSFGLIFAIFTILCFVGGNFRQSMNFFIQALALSSSGAEIIKWLFYISFSVAILSITIPQIEKMNIRYVVPLLKRAVPHFFVTWAVRRGIAEESAEETFYSGIGFLVLISIVVVELFLPTQKVPYPKQISSVEMLKARPVNVLLQVPSKPIKVNSKQVLPPPETSILSGRALVKRLGNGSYLVTFVDGNRESK